MITIEHPAWAHQYHYIIRQLQQGGNRVLVAVIEKDNNINILDHYGIEYTVIHKGIGKSMLSKAFILVKTVAKCVDLIIRNKIEVLFGRETPVLAVAAFLTGRKFYCYADTETATISLLSCRCFAEKIVTGRSFEKDLGKNHLRVDAFKELFYLDPKYFDASLYSKEVLGLPAQNSPVIFLRFVAWDASHDLGIEHLGTKQKTDLALKLAEFGTLLISSETDLPEQLAAYEYKGDFALIHHYLAKCDLVIGDSATMAAEAALLGVPAVYITTFELGYISELQVKGLIKTFTLEDMSELTNYIKGILSNSETAEQHKKGANNIIKEKIDINNYFLDLLAR